MRLPPLSKPFAVNVTGGFALPLALLDSITTPNGVTFVVIAGSGLPSLPGRYTVYSLPDPSCFTDVLNVAGLPVFSSITGFTLPSLSMKVGLNTPV